MSQRPAHLEALRRLQAHPCSETLQAGLDALAQGADAALRHATLEARVLLGERAAEALDELASEAHADERPMDAQVYAEAALALAPSELRLEQYGSRRELVVAQRAERLAALRPADCPLTVLLPAGEDLPDRVRQALAEIDHGDELLAYGPPAELRSLVGEQRRLRRHETSHRPLAALEQALAQTRGRWLLLLLPAVRLRPGALAAHRERLASCASGVILLDRDHASVASPAAGWRGRLWRRLTPPERPVEHWRFDPWAAPSRVLVRREAALAALPLARSLGPSAFALWLAELAGEHGWQAWGELLVEHPGGELAEQLREPSRLRRALGRELAQLLLARRAEHAREQARVAASRAQARELVVCQRRAAAGGQESHASLRQALELSLATDAREQSEHLLGYHFAQGDARWALERLWSSPSGAGLRGRLRWLLRLRRELAHAALSRRPWLEPWNRELLDCAFPWLGPAAAAALSRLLGWASAPPRAARWSTQLAEGLARGLALAGGREALARLRYALALGTPPDPLRLLTRDRKLPRRCARLLRRRLRRPLPSIGLAVTLSEQQLGRVAALLQSLERQLLQPKRVVLVAPEALRRQLEQLVEPRRQLHKRLRLRTLPGSPSAARAALLGLEALDTDFVMLVEASDLLLPDCLLALSRPLQRQPEIDLVYADEDRLDGQDQPERPVLKPGWSPELLTNLPYIGRPWLLRRQLLQGLETPDASLGAAWEHDLLLQLGRRLRRVEHLPVVLYRRRVCPRLDLPERNGFNTDFPPSSAKVLEAHQQRGLEPAEVQPSELPGRWRLRRHVRGEALVSVLLPSQGRPETLEPLLEALHQQLDWPQLEVLLLDQGFGRGETRELLRRWPVRLLRWRGPFNSSRMNNAAAALARGELLLLLDEATSWSDPGWLRALVAQAQRPEVGIVGARLLYPDGLVQHAGMVLSDRPQTIARHGFRFWSPAGGGYLGLIACAREQPAVTAACALLRREVYEQVGGFDERLARQLNDVDLCLRIRQRGYRVLYEPAASLTRLGGGSRHQPQQGHHHEARMLLERWRPQLAADPYYHPDLGLGDRTHELTPEAAYRRLLEMRYRH